MDEIEVLRQVLAKNPIDTGHNRNRNCACDRFRLQPPDVLNKVSNSRRLPIASAPQEEPHKWGTYTPNFGFKVANTDRGDVSISIYSYARYLNQLGLDPTYTDAFGNVKNVQQRQDFQLNKVQIKFLGWIIDPKFRYFLYAWSSNASQGLGAQVVLAGNLNYTFNKSFNIGAGIQVPAGYAERGGQLSLLAWRRYPPDRRRVLSPFVHLRRLGLGQNHRTGWTT